MDITVARNQVSENQSKNKFLQLQDDIFHAFGDSEPAAPVLRCRNATQTSVVLEWDPIELATADVLSLSLFRNGQKAGNIPRPMVMQSTKISGLAVDTEYIFHLVLRTTAGTFSSEKVAVRTHKMTDLSGITVTPGILPAQLRESLVKAVERIGAKMADTVRIDTTHFVTTEGRGISWEKAVEMNIPVVRPEWVEGCERGGRIVGVRQYYLDADPRQRNIINAQLLSPAESQQSISPRIDAPLPEPPAERNQAQGTNGNTAPPRFASMEIVKGKLEADEDGDQDEGAISALEQKTKVKDFERQKVIIPKDEQGVSKTTGGKQVSEEGKAGERSPGEATFQDIAL